ncbi:MAG: zinc-binding dehydrogenase [Bacillota bacterium]|nr:zinc-binding dehydrogenase [Bacillota bacterium]
MNYTKVMVLKEFNKPLVQEEMVIPELKDGEILVKITAAGVCGSDAHMWRGKDPRTPLPIILGHEGVGIVVAIKGSKTTIFGGEIKEGDNILWHRGISCGTCYYCQIIKQPALCEKRWVYGIHRPINEPPYLVGCYGEHIILAAGTDIFPIPKNVPPKVLVSASCSGSTTAHGFDLAPPKPGETVVIQGPGPLGIYAVAFAKAYGAKEIIVIGGTAERIAMCKEFGATRVLDRNSYSESERKEAVLELTDGRGADVVFEAVGTPQAVKEGIGLTRVGGRYVSAGFGEPNGTVELDCFQDVVRKNLRYQGVWVSDTKHTYQAYQLVLQNIELFSKMVTHEYSLCDATTALEKMESREAIKAVLIP